jgi:hypothetical protein
MSHITKIGLQIKDLDALDKACGRLGLELMRGQQTFKAYTRINKCDHAIRVKDNADAYEIGLVKRADGKGYDVSWDSFNGGYGLCKVVGYGSVKPNADRLKDWYAAEVSRKQMARQGFQVKMNQLDGKVQVLCSK